MASDRSRWEAERREADALVATWPAQYAAAWVSALRLARARETELEKAERDEARRDADGAQILLGKARQQLAQALYERDEAQAALVGRARARGRVCNEDIEAIWKPASTRDSGAIDRLEGQKENHD
jgi:hypothetical protein